MRLRGFFLGITVSAALLMGAGLAWLYTMQDALLYPGADAVRPFGDLRVQRPDAALRGWVVHADASDALVVFGGNGMSLSRFAPRLGSCSSRAIYLLPYRGYEGQAGTPREQTMVEDGIALVTEAAKTHAHVAILGISLGTGIATQVAAAHHPERLVLVTPYDSMVAVGSAKFYGLPLGWMMHDHYESAEAAARLNDVPVYLLQAAHDEVIPAARTEALARALPQLPAGWENVDAGHNSILASEEFCRLLSF